MLDPNANHGYLYTIRIKFFANTKEGEKIDVRRLVFLSCIGINRTTEKTAKGGMKTSLANRYMSNY